jgi:hypothetical protein
VVGEKKVGSMLVLYAVAGPNSQFSDGKKGLTYEITRHMLKVECDGHGQSRIPLINSNCLTSIV